MSRVTTNTITETRIVPVGHTFTVTLSEREAALLAYMVGRIPLALLEYDTTLYEALTETTEGDTIGWGGPDNLLPSLADAAKIRERLRAYSNRHE